MLIGVWGDQCELRMLALWSAAAAASLPHTERLSLCNLCLGGQVAPALSVTSPVRRTPETDPAGTPSALRPVDSSEIFGPGYWRKDEKDRLRWWKIIGGIFCTLKLFKNQAPSG